MQTSYSSIEHLNDPAQDGQAATPTAPPSPPADSAELSSRVRFTTTGEGERSSSHSGCDRNSQASSVGVKVGTQPVSIAAAGGATSSGGSLSAARLTQSKLDERQHSWSSIGAGGMSHDEEQARPPARSCFDILFRKSDHPPLVVELYALNPTAANQRVLKRHSLISQLRHKAAYFAALRQQELEQHHALERQAARPYKDAVTVQQTGVKRMHVVVRRQYLLQFPDGRVAFFAMDPADPDKPPLFVPVLRVIRQREAWMNLRLFKRGEDGANVEQMGGRFGTSGVLLAEYELVRTDGRVLLPEDILHEPLALHNEIGRLKREARRLRIDPTAELQDIVQRLPRTYHSVGVRVYNPKKAKWKMQVVWIVMIGCAVFLSLFLLAVLATYWPHIQDQGTDEFLSAYLIDTLLIQAFACEFREILNLVIANVVMRQLLLLLCCLHCASRNTKEKYGLSKTSDGARNSLLDRDSATKARQGLARGMSRQLSRMATISNLGVSRGSILTNRRVSVLPRLMSVDCELACFELLRSAISEHAVARGQLMAIKRTWRLQHIIDGVLHYQERARSSMLQSAESSTEWVAWRHHRLWELVHSVGAATKDEAYQQLMARLSEVLSPLVADPVSAIASSEASGAARRRRASLAAETAILSKLETYVEQAGQEAAAEAMMLKEHPEEGALEAVPVAGADPPAPAEATAEAPAEDTTAPEADSEAEARGEAGSEAASLVPERAEAPAVTEAAAQVGQDSPAGGGRQVQRRRQRQRQSRRWCMKHRSRRDTHSARGQRRA